MDNFYLYYYSPTLMQVRADRIAHTVLCKESNRFVMGERTHSYCIHPICTVSPRSFISVPVAKCYQIKAFPPHSVEQQAYPFTTFHDNRSLLKKNNNPVFPPIFPAKAIFQLPECHEKRQSHCFLWLLSPRAGVSGAIFGVLEDAYTPV